MVSSHLSGFSEVPGCESLGEVWDGAHGCSAEIRRLNVWSADLGILSLVGPGYLPRSLATMSAPVHGMDAGLMSYEDNEGFAVKGYGAPVLSGGTYLVSGDWKGDVVFEFSDPILETIMESNDTLNLVINGTDTGCAMHAHDSRRFLSPNGLDVPGVLGEGMPAPCKLIAPIPVNLVTDPALGTGSSMEIKNRGGLCLDSPAYFKNTGRLQMLSCDRSRASQRWLYDPETLLLGVSNGRCLDAPHSGKPGSQVHMWSCWRWNANQQWVYNAATGQLQVRDSLCLDAYESQAEGGGVRMWPCAHDTDQEWILTPL